jgi:hypothetical protein
LRKKIETERLFLRKKIKRLYSAVWGDKMFVDTTKHQEGDKMRDNLKPVHIRNSTNDVLVFSKENGGDGVEVLVADENVWLTQKSMCSLYETSKSSVSEHLTNIFASGELDENSVVRNFRTTATDGKTYNYKYYNLQAIIAVGFKVNSEKAVRFRAWAADILAGFAMKGYVLDNLGDRAQRHNSQVRCDYCQKLSGRTGNAVARTDRHSIFGICGVSSDAADPDVARRLEEAARPVPASSRHGFADQCG